MFDEGSGGDTVVYWAGTSATIVNGSWTNQGIENPSLQAGTDYATYTDPVRVEVLSGGYLEGAPVLFVSWTQLPLGGGNVWAILGAALAMVGLGAGARYVAMAFHDL